MRAPLIINDEPISVAQRPAPPMPSPTPRARVFDHLDAIPFQPPPADEEAHFVRVAKAMRSSTWWKTIPDTREPRCSMCGARQFRAGKHGDTCINGHGGAPSLERWP